MIKSDAVDDPGAPVSAEEPDVGAWPRLAEALPLSKEPADLLEGMRLLMTYLVDRDYCQSFQATPPLRSLLGELRFVSYTENAADLRATASLMRSNEDFGPRFDQRILQAYFKDCGLDSSFKDSLANSLEGEAGVEGESRARSGHGIRTEWRLTPVLAS